MGDTLFFLVLIILFSAFLVFKLIKGIKNIINYKTGYIDKAIITNLFWKKAPITRFSYLYPKEMLRVSYQFTIDNDSYVKDEDDINFYFKKNDYQILPKVGDMIQVFVPKNKNPNKVTINKPNKSILPLVLLSILLIFSLGIIFLIINNY